MKQLFIVRGVPGSGKTTFAGLLAEATVAKHVEADILRDTLFGGRHNFVWNEENNRYVHDECMRQAHYWLKHGWDVVVSNTFCTIERMKPYFDIAAETRAKVTVLHVQARHGSVHDNVDQKYYEDEWEEYKGELHE